MGEKIPSFHKELVSVFYFTSILAVFCSFTLYSISLSDIFGVFKLRAKFNRNWEQGCQSVQR